MKKSYPQRAPDAVIAIQVAWGGGAEAGKRSLSEGKVPGDTAPPQAPNTRSADLSPRPLSAEPP
jgi:hypothetical protein